jgi:hypothetical protein
MRNLIAAIIFLIGALPCAAKTWDIHGEIAVYMKKWPEQFVPGNNHGLIELEKLIASIPVDDDAEYRFGYLALIEDIQDLMKDQRACNEKIAEFKIRNTNYKSFEGKRRRELQQMIEVFSIICSN